MGCQPKGMRWIDHPEDDEFLLAHYAITPAAQLARTLPSGIIRTPHGIYNRIKKLLELGRAVARPEPRPAPEPETEGAEPNPLTELTLEADKLRTENGELRHGAVVLQRQLARAKSRTADLVSAVFQAAREAGVIVGAPTIIAGGHDPRPEPEVALLHVCDWQTGKRTETFNTAVAAERVALLAEKVLLLATIERAAHPVNQCVVLLGGDFIENVAIFPGQAWEVDSQAFEQLFSAARMLDGLLRTLAGHFETVDCWTEWGNHGRIGRKGDYPRSDNIDLLLYRMLADRHTGTNISWHISPKWHQIVPIGNYRALLVHGDEFKSFGGATPAFGIARKVNAWATGVIEPFTDCYISHFHQIMQVPLANGRGRAFLTPSIESGNEYAEEFVGATGTPAQRLHFIHPENGRVTTERIVYLDGPLGIDPSLTTETQPEAA